MKKLLVLAMAGLSNFASASKKPQKPQDPPCSIIYTVVKKDILGNITQGVSKDALKWVNGDLKKKNPSVCYKDPDPSIKVVFLLTVERQKYNGTRTVNHTATTNGSTNNGGSYEGTTTYSEEVPDNFDYGRYTLTVETFDDDHKVTVRHRFQQDGIYRTMYGIPLGGRGHHPDRALLEDAVKWVASGALNDPLQSAQ